ncbi:MAG TPA: NAD-dependent epimerase/dehydratase family protein [Steroidobacteraceae bacterium]|nr:NAD-dependent epimerase/dehydratase family protein [Steroidobacteraceae bacterium]
MAATYLVTGCAGFLGSNLVGRMLEAGDSVVGIDNLSMGCADNLAEFEGDRRFRFVQADVTDPAVLARAYGSFDAIVHLAAFKIPRYGKAIDTLKINYRGTENALELARRLGCKLVLASTSDVYGRNPELPFSEASSDHVIGNSKSPRWGYAVSKLFDEHLALAYQDAYGFPVTILRFFGSYGPNQPLSWWGGPPPVFIDCVLNDKPMPIHGDGSQTRSFTYVSDTVEGIYQATARPEANGEIINIGNTEEITILELAQRVKKASGTPGELKVEFVPYASFSGRKYEDVMRRVPDVALCERLLGVRARVGIDEGLARTIAWQRAAAARRAAG